MKLGAFVKEKLGAILCTVFVLAAARLMGYACKVRGDYINVLSGIIILCVVCLFLAEYIKKRRFYREFRNILDELDQKYLITEMMLQPDFEEGKIWMEALYEIDRSMMERINKMETTVRDFKEYLELWIHEIKVPIAALKLMNYNGNTDAKKQKLQIDRMNDYVEQILFYARADAPEKDYLLNPCKLDVAINSVLLQQKDLLIGNHVHIEKEHTDISVITDSKWLTFMVGQLVNNSVKYMDAEKTPQIRFSAENTEQETILSIWDNGIGIDEKDIDRVFEKTFTGENGRKGNISTGMGLYICKRLCEKLGHRIDISSKKGEYTEVRLHFGKNDFYFDE
ncbi:MAG: sensor histidine kinase [Wujia sp.]